MSRGWLLLVCTVTYIYVASLVPPIYKALPGTYIFTYLTYPYTVCTLPIPYTPIYLFIYLPLYLSLLFTPILNPYTYLPYPYITYPYTLYMYTHTS